MKNVVRILPLALMFACSGTDEDTGDTAAEQSVDTAEELGE